MFATAMGMLRSAFGPRRRYYGLDGLDRRLERWLDFDRGVFVEAGANNGTNQSNTCYFERCRGWTGLLVEPIAERAEECRRNRPRSIVETCALGPPKRDGGEITLTYCNLMTVPQGGMLAGEARDRHIATGAALQKIEPYDFTVTCRSLSSLLDQHAMTHVDLLSLDVEGFEAPALEGLDLTRHRPVFILVEARDEAAIRTRLGGHYEEVARLSHHDVLYRLRGAAAGAMRPAGTNRVRGAESS